MTFLLGDTGKSQVGPLKNYVITLATPRETLLGTALTLPTTEPATSQVSFTVQSADLPIISPSVPLKYYGVPNVSGKVGATAAVISYRVLKNGVSIAQASGASATATQFWTHSHYRLFDVQIGDVLEVRYWANQTDVTLDFYGFVVYPSQPDVFKRGTVTKDFTFSNPITVPDFISTTFTTSTTVSYFIHPNTGTAWNITASNASHPVVFSAFSPNPTYGVFRIGSGEGNGLPQTFQGVSATQRQITKQWLPSTFTFREVLR
jgi:hypothetical protein